MSNLWPSPVQRRRAGTQGPPPPPAYQPRATGSQRSGYDLTAAYPPSCQWCSSYTAFPSVPWTYPVFSHLKSSAPARKFLFQILAWGILSLHWGLSSNVILSKRHSTTAVLNPLAGLHLNTGLILFSSLYSFFRNDLIDLCPTSPYWWQWLDLLLSVASHPGPGIAAGTLYVCVGI